MIEPEIARNVKPFRKYSRKSSGVGPGRCPQTPQHIHPFLEPGVPIRRQSSRHADPVPPQHTVLILNESRKRHGQDAFLPPSRLGGDGEDLGG